MVFGAREDIYDFDVDVRTHFLDHLCGGLDGLLHLLITELGSGSMNRIEGLVHHLDLRQRLRCCSRKSTVAL